MGDELIVSADRIGIVAGVPAGSTLEAAE